MSNVSGLILAGGQSSRMGTDKSYLPFRDQTFLERAFHCLESTGIKRIYVSGNHAGYTCIEDRWPKAGPSAAIMSALLNPLLSATESIVVIPIDMPLLSSEPLFTLMHIIKHSPNIAASFFRNYPLPCCVKTGALKNVITHYVSNPEISVKTLLTEHVYHQIIDVEKNIEKQFVNINTPHEFSECQ